MSVTDEFTEELYKQQSGIVLLTVVEISHSEFDDTFYLVDNTESITYDGNDYEPMALSFSMPDDSNELSSSTSLEIDNVDRTVILQLRQVTTTTKPDINISLVSVIDGTVRLERGPYPYKLNDIEYDLYSISATIGYNDELEYNFPTLTMTSTNCPGIY